MADIGTDHGFLPLHLWKSGNSPRVIMCDISEASLAKAKSAAAIFQSDKGLGFRVGDGLRTLASGEVDKVVIAGMGGNLIIDILSDDIDKTMSFEGFVFQARNNSANLRYWLVNNAFEISNNLLVREGKFICEVICTEPKKSSQTNDYELSGPNGARTYREVENKDSGYWDLPSELFTSQLELASEYASIKLNKEKKIEMGIMSATTPDYEELDRVRKRIRYFESLL